MTQPPPASPHSGKRRISSARRAFASLPKTPLVCCLFQSLFRSFMISSLPLSHTVTPPDTTHGPLATPATGHQLSFFLSFSSLFSLSFFLSFFFFFLLQFSGAPFLSFSYFLILYSCTAICFLYFINYFLILVLYYLFHCFSCNQYTVTMSLLITCFM